MLNQTDRIMVLSLNADHTISFIFGQMISTGLYYHWTKTFKQTKISQISIQIRQLKHLLLKKLLILLFENSKCHPWILKDCICTFFSYLSYMDSPILRVFFSLTNGLCGQNVSKPFIIDWESNKPKSTTTPTTSERKRHWNGS